MLQDGLFRLVSPLLLLLVLVVFFMWCCACRQQSSHSAATGARPHILVWSGLEQLVTATAPLMDQKYALEALLHFTSLFYAPLERPTVPLFNFKSRSAPEECLLKINLSKEGQEMLKSKDI